MSKPTSIRRKLTSAAINLFRSNGYEKTSVNDICTAVDISRASFYSLFASKKDLVLSDIRDAAQVNNIKPSEILFLDNDFERMIYIFTVHTSLCTKANVDYCKAILKLEIDKKLGIFDFADAYNELYCKLISNCQRDCIIRNTGEPAILIKYAIQIAKATLIDWCRSNAAFDFHETVRTSAEEYYDVAPEYRKGGSSLS